MRLADLVTSLLAQNVEHGAKPVRVINEENGDVSNVIGITLDHDAVYIKVEHNEEI